MKHSKLNWGAVALYIISAGLIIAFFLNAAKEIL